MRVLILGGSGETGQLVVEEALRRGKLRSAQFLDISRHPLNIQDPGHNVTALLRSPSSITAQDNLTIVTGTPLNPADIEKAFAATSDTPDAVLVTLKARAGSSNTPKATTLMADSVTNAIASMRTHGIRKLVIMQAQGTGKSWPSVPFPIRAFFTHNSSMRADFEDHNQVEKVVRQEAVKGDLDFVLLRPVMLVGGEALPVKFFPEEGTGVGWLPKITRKSVAATIMDAAQSTDHDGSSPVIANCFRPNDLLPY
jgi:nucleoside-diphosphate-sugar epimerase